MKNKYFVVSNDKGFDKTCSFWEAQGVTIERISMVASDMETKNKKTKVSTAVWKQQKGRKGVSEAKAPVDRKEKNIAKKDFGKMLRVLMTIIKW